jgi:hypothetical protein
MKMAGISRAATVFAEIVGNKIVPPEVKRVEPGLEGRIRKGTRMKRASLLLIIGIVAGLTVLGVGAVAPVPAPKSSEIKQLKKEVAALRQRIESLEQRLTLRVIPISSQDGKALQGVIDPYHGVRQVPPNSRQFEFNGMTYYIVPINKTSKPASETPRQVQPDKSSTAPTDSVPKP